MRHYDLSPLYRSTVGFDRMFRLLDNLGQPDTGTCYPPYNIERTGENAYRITMAVAGFSDAELTIEIKENALSIRGRKDDGDAESESKFLHQGIASRAFERRFQLADHVEVKGASLEHGLLHVDLEREIPEAMKARTISITAQKNEPKVLESA